MKNSQMYVFVCSIKGLSKQLQVFKKCNFDNLTIIIIIIILRVIITIIIMIPIIV